MRAQHSDNGVLFWAPHYRYSLPKARVLESRSVEDIFVDLLNIGDASTPSPLRWWPPGTEAPFVPAGKPLLLAL